MESVKSAKAKKTAAEKQVDAWNKNMLVGSSVLVEKDDGTKFRTVTRSMAGMLPSGQAVVWVKGITGCYLLDRVRPWLD